MTNFETIKNDIEQKKIQIEQQKNQEQEKQDS